MFVGLSKSCCQKVTALCSYSGDSISLIKRYWHMSHGEKKINFSQINISILNVILNKGVVTLIELSITLF
jgi:hypothetical protein